MIMEAEKSHGLLSASWRPREDSGVQPVQAKSQKAPKPREADDSLSPRAGEDQCPSSVGQRERSLPQPFFQALN